MFALLASLGIFTPPFVVPPTRTVNEVSTHFGTAVADPYRWLEDARSGEVQGWLTAQDNVARASLARVPFRGALHQRLTALGRVETLGVPTLRRGRLFHVRRPAGAEKGILYWRSGADGTDRVLLDPATLSADGSVAMQAWSPSWNGRRLAYGVSPKNADELALRIRDVDTGRDLPDIVEGARWSTAVWAGNDEGFYYTFTPPAGPTIVEADRAAHAVLKYHRLGTDAKQDPIVHGPLGNATHFIAPQTTADGRWLLAVTYRGWSTTDIELLDVSTNPVGATAGGRASGPTSVWRPLVYGVKAQFTADYHGGTFFLRTDDGAPRGRLVAVDPAHPERANWRELVAQDAEATLESASVVGGHLLLDYTRKACGEAEIRTLDGKPLRRLVTPPAVAFEGFAGEADHPELYFAWSSLTQPLTIARGRVDSAETHTWAQVRLPVDLSAFETRQVTYKSRDGTPISMFLVHKKGLSRSGETPFYLTGYGGFALPLSPQFSARRVPWLEAGGGLAIPNLRGGSEYGESWHQAGMREKKQNVFDDFVAAAEYLIHEGYTSPKKLVISGRSNGGLLVGAAMTQRPELFRAVVCGVPLLDMVRYHRFGAGMTWVDEYGSADTESEFKALFAYSPYHRVKKGTAYPTTLLLSVDADDRVDPLHARKMAAALQAATTGGPILLRVETNAGHGGADRLSQELEEDADVFAFAMDAVGLKPR